MFIQPGGGRIEFIHPPPKQVVFRKKDGGEIVFGKFNPYHDRLGRFTSAAGAGAVIPDKRGGRAEESDIADSVRRAAKSLATGQKVIGFKELPKEFQRQFRQQLTQAAPEAKELIRKHYRQADYILQEGLRSSYRRGFVQDVIILGENASPSTLAHELFHKLDKGRKISAQLAESLAKDKAALEAASRGRIKDFLAWRYSEAFEAKDLHSNHSRMKEPYRGISDIIDGMTRGKIQLGYGHRPEYWARPGSLEAEAWAQFGRMQFENNPKALKMLNELFPKFSEDAMIMLKELR